jgi:hypothetical protein
VNGTHPGTVYTLRLLYMPTDKICCVSNFTANSTSLQIEKSSITAISSMELPLSNPVLQDNIVRNSSLNDEKRMRLVLNSDEGIVRIGLG